MTTQLWNRKYKLIIGDAKTRQGVELTDYQITFDISKSTDNSKSTNSATIEIYNLSKDELKVLAVDYPACAFYLGWGLLEDVKLVFGGQITKVTTRKQGTDIVTQLKLGTGYTELNHDALSKVVPAGRTVKDVFEEIRKSIPNVSRGVYNGTNLSNPIINGYPISGTAKQVLDNLSSTYNVEYRFEAEDKTNMVLYVNDKNRPENENFSNAFDISPDSGLIDLPFDITGDPNMGTDDPDKRHGVQFSMLINPELRCGQIIKLSGTDTTGWFKIDSMRLSGSFRDGNFLQEIKCSAIEKVVKK